MTTPATQIFSFQCLIPANTPLSAPVTADCSFPDADVVGVRWRVPPGPSGFMGFQITSDGAPVIPAGQGNYIIADDEYQTWPVTGFQSSGSWQVTGYNTDNYDHSVYLDFLTVPPGTSQGAGTTSGGSVPAAPPAALQPAPPDPASYTPGVQVPG